MVKQNRIRKFTVISATLFIAILTGFAMADSPPAPGLPSVTSYWGYITNNGTPSQEVAVSIYDNNGTLLANTISMQGGLYQLAAPWNDPATPADEGVAAGESITFKLNGVTALVRTVDAQATNNRLDISVSGTVNYDSNGNGRIDRNEAVQAVMDYFDGKISRQVAIDVIMRYFSGL